MNIREVIKKVFKTWKDYGYGHIARKDPISENLRKDIAPEYILRIESFNQDDKYYEIDLRGIFCSCSNFKEDRQQFSLDDPRRLCKHLIAALNRCADFPQHFCRYKKYLKILGRYNKSFKPMAHRSITEIDGKQIDLFTDIYDENISEYGIVVFIDSQHHRFNPETNLWFYGEEIEISSKEKIEQWLQSNLLTFQPGPLEADAFKTVYRNQAKKSYNIKGATVSGKIAWMYVKPNISIVDVKVQDCRLEFDKEKGSYKIDLRLKYMEKALLKWIADEFETMKKLQENKK